MPQLFKPTQIIWQKDTKEPFYVIHVYRNATFVVPLTENNLPTPRAILERDYEKFVKDEDAT